MMIKTSIYDDFSCVADKCKLTCCRGWSIRVEDVDMDLWKQSEQTAYLCDFTSFQKRDEEAVYQMKLNSCKTCMLLDEAGLCEIVKKHGDAYLSKTCREFPRKHNVICKETEEDNHHIIMDEYALSGACPRVLELIDEKCNRKVVEIPASCREGLEFPMEYRIRNMLLYFLEETQYSLRDKIILCFHFLHECISCEWEEDVYDCMEVYMEEENQREYLGAYKEMQYDNMQAFDEVLQTFLDMTEFYKEEDMFRPYLADLYSVAEKLDIHAHIEEWEKFKESFSVEDIFLEKVMASELFQDCISDDLEVFIESFQSIVMEYVMTRVSLFLKSVMEQKNTYIQDKKEVITYLSLYIRMIGHNVEGMSEYWLENFDDSILEKEYLFLLLG